MCSGLRNRKGIVGTIVGAQMLFIGATLIRVIAIAPILVCSMESFSLPSLPPENTLMLCLPLVSFLSVSLICFTASVVG